MQTSLQRDGLILARRFTDELKGETTLERATISAQEQGDANEKALHRRRMEALYRDPDKDPRYVYNPKRCVRVCFDLRQRVQLT
jgi:hypothetical protein